MVNRTRRLLDGVRAFSPLLQAYEAGFTIEEVKTGILNSLEPEFKNSIMLNRYGIELLAVESVNITKIRNNNLASKIYDISLSMRRKSLESDENLCSKICSQWEESIGKALSLYWSAVKLEHYKSALPIDEFAYEIFRNIGSLIEGTFQIYLKELLHITMHAQGELVSYSEVSSLSLGSVINKLSRRLGSSDLFTLSPWGELATF